MTDKHRNTSALALALIKEMEVVLSVVRFLRDERKYEINHVVEETSERGPDVTATSPKKRVTIQVEAKGQTSSDPRTPRYGKEFLTKQKDDHLAKALLSSLEEISEGFVAGIALPEDAHDFAKIDKIRKPLEQLGVIVFMVDQKLHARVDVGELPE